MATFSTGFNTGPNNDQTSMTTERTVETGIKKKDIITYIISNSVSDTDYGHSASVVSITDDDILTVRMSAYGSGLWFVEVNATISVIYRNR